MSRLGCAFMWHFQPEVHHVWMSDSPPCIVICIMLCEVKNVRGQLLSRVIKESLLPQMVCKMLCIATEICQLLHCWVKSHIWKGWNIYSLFTMVWRQIFFVTHMHIIYHTNACKMVVIVNNLEIMIKWKKTEKQKRKKRLKEENKRRAFFIDLHQKSFSSVQYIIKYSMFSVKNIQSYKNLVHSFIQCHQTHHICLVKHC